MALTSTQIQTIITQLYTVLSEKGGIAQVVFDGRVIRYEGVDKITEGIRFWESRLARADGSRPPAMRHNLGEF